MSKIRFEPGDTLGGTAPITLLKQIDGSRLGRGGRRARHRRRRSKWPYAAGLAAGAAAVWALVSHLGS